MKQFHLIGRRKCDHNAMLTVSTLILAIVQGTKGDQIYGLKFECEKSSDYREFVLMDFDELKELLQAIKNLIGLAKQISTGCDEYTECEYVTKNCFKIGFYQEPHGQQQAFLNLSETSSKILLSFDDLRMVFDLIKSGREYLIEKGAQGGSS